MPLTPAALLVALGIALAYLGGAKVIQVGKKVKHTITKPFHRAKPKTVDPSTTRPNP